MKEKIQKKDELFENKKELEEYKLSYYKWGSCFFKASFASVMIFIFAIIIGLIK